MTAYRYPNEQLVLFITAFLVLTLTVLLAGPTLCLAPLLLVVIIVYAYRINANHHQALLRSALPVTSTNAPRLARVAGEVVQRLRTGPVQFFVAPGPAVNAYTFGLSDPKIIVLYSRLLKVMDPVEVRFVMGHELGHVALNHAWLNTLLGGMAGVPLPFEAAIVLILAFRWWNRMCEYSADRAGLLACGDPDRAISALVKLFSADADTPEEIREALAVIEREDDSPLNILAETVSTHPMLVRRIDKLRQWAGTEEYHRLQNQVNRLA